MILIKAAHMVMFQHDVHVHVDLYQVCAKNFGTTLGHKEIRLLQAFGNHNLPYHVHIHKQQSSTPPNVAIPNVTL